MTLVAGVDSSTQSCKVLVCDAESGQVIRSGTAKHPEGTEVDPKHWLTALEQAIEEAGGIDDVSAISIGGQQHGMVLLDEAGEVLRPALLWNDTRSAPQAKKLIRELGEAHSTAGERAWAEMVGSVPVASFTATKLRWVSESEPELMAKAKMVCLPHDWLSWKLSGSKNLSDVFTDRSDASGTGYWSSITEQYLPEVLRLACGKDLLVPKIISEYEFGFEAKGGIKIAAGMGDNAAAAFGLGAQLVDGVISLGTSGVVSAISATSTKDPSGIVAGFAAGTGNYLPLACTLNGARVIDSTARLLGLTHQELAQLALSAPAGSQGLTMLPYFEGERTPNLPDASGSLYGITGENLTPANLARAAIEGLLCGLADALDALTELGVKVRSLKLVGGAAKNEAVQKLAPVIFGMPIELPPVAEYVALGAARQAASALAGRDVAWQLAGTQTLTGEIDVATRERYRIARESYVSSISV
jgi:xylulokinase